MTNQPAILKECHQVCALYRGERQFVTDVLFLRQLFGSGGVSGASWRLADESKVTSARGRERVNPGIIFRPIYQFMRLACRESGLAPDKLEQVSLFLLLCFVVSFVVLLIIVPVPLRQVNFASCTLTSAT